MDIHRLKDLSPDDRLSVLQGEAAKIEEQVYTRFLSDDELDRKKDELTKNAILIATIEEEKKAEMQAYKDKLDPIRDAFKECREALKVGGIQETGLVYVIPDHDQSMMHVITSAGDLLHSRRMLPEERQFRLPNMKTANG